MIEAPKRIEDDILRALIEVEALLARAFAAVEAAPEVDDPLDQEGIRDGGVIVADYLRHGEAGLALEHLLYMVREPSLPISLGAFTLIERAGRALGLDPGTWSTIRPGGGEPSEGGTG